MSRIHEALKLAEELKAKQEPPPASPRAFARMVLDPEPTLEAPTFTPEPKAPLTTWGRWVRQIRRWMGLKTGGPAPSCTGWTRTGLKCRAPAMANGYCRVHGGSRNVLARPQRS